MSKKMLKRSLALGALMAFVITGSAMAAELPTDVKVNSGDYDVLANTEIIDASNEVAVGNPEGAQYSGKVNIDVQNESTLTITSSGNEGGNIHGVIANTTITGNGIVYLNRTTQYPVNSTTEKLAVLGQKSVDSVTAKEIHISTADGYGVYATESGDSHTLNAEKITITTSMKSANNGTGALYAAGGGAISVTGFDALIINVTNTTDIEGEGGPGIFANAGSAVVVTGNEKISSIYVKSEGRGAIVANGGSLDIDADSLTASSVNLAGEDNALSCTRKNSVVVAQGSTSLLDINVTGDFTVTAEDDMNALGAYQNGSVLINGNNVTVNGQVHAQGSEGPDTKAHIGITASNDVTINGRLSAHWAYGDGTSSTKGIDINGKNITVNAGDENVMYNGAGETRLVAEEKLVLSGLNALCSDGGQIDVSAKEIYINADDRAVSSYYSGIVNITPVGEEGFSKIVGDIFVDNSATQVVNVELGKGGSLTGAVINDGSGNVNLDLGEGSIFNATENSKLTSLSGNGTVGVANLETTVKIADTSSLGDVTVSTSSDNLGTDVSAGMEKLNTLVTSGDSTIADKLVATAGAMYDEVTADVVDGKVQNVEKEVAAANISVNDMAAIGLMSWRAEMNDMNKRMGELRNANGEHGVWVRMVRGESEYNSVKNQYNQYQLGYDEKLSTDPSWTVGVALSYTDAENNFAEGYGESTNKALSIYGSKLNEDGTFIDLIAKYARLENDFTTYSGQGAGEYDANGYSFSAEFGKRIQQGNGLWIEPQVELTYGEVGSANYVTEKGVNVAQDSMDSIVGRIGFSLGKDIKDGNVYARASYLYDFDGETKAVLNGVETLEQDLGGGWWEVGVGANINLSKATYIYADVEKTFGGEVDTNWQWNLGVRYSF